MDIRIYPLVLGVALSAVLVAGCNRQEPVPATAPAPPPTTMGTQLDDTMVTAKVKSALLDDHDVKGLDTKVETRKGVVQLSGFVDNAAQAERAVSVTRGVAGVTGVQDSMTIKDGKETVGNKLDDGIVTAKVKSALLSDAGVRSGDIAVATSKGEVQLSGFVDNQAQIDRAMGVTRGVEGVQGILNEMSIKK